MSSESTANPSPSERRAAELAARLQSRLGTVKEQQKQESTWGTSRTICRALAPAYGVSPALVSRYWVEHKEEDYEDIFLDDAVAEGLSSLSLYPRLLKKDTFWGQISHGSFSSSAVWKSFIGKMLKDSDAVLGFALRGGQVWVITTRVFTNTPVLKPIITIPVNGNSPWVNILPAAVFVEAYL